MPKRLLLVLSCSFLLFNSIQPVFAQTAESVQEEPLGTDEEPELPPEDLQLPEEDPQAVASPDPLEEDFLRMPLAADPLFWRVELREQLGWTSNVQQTPAGSGSAFNRTSLNGVLRYTLPSETQLLLRSQVGLFNHFNVPDSDAVVAIPLSLTASQWFGPQLNVYAGYLPIFSSSIFRSDNTSLQRLDHDVMLGSAFYHMIGEGDYLFGGYQFDFFAAGLPTYSHLGNLFFAGYRHRFRDDLFLFADARLQARGYNDTPDFADELRLGGGLAMQWHILRPWLILEARADYNQFMNWTQPERSANIASIGIQVISALQSER